MKSRTIILLGFALALACGATNAQPIAERNGTLRSADGRTLYTFDVDAPGRSACNGGCATAWPPYLANESDRPFERFAIVVRYDGSKQWAVDGKPLYFFGGDARPGEVRGDGHSGLWHVAKQTEARGKRASYFRQVFSR
jgi:predicted lipoprotein with Yx(FWY)xxD motif